MLGKIEKIKIREIWQHEALDFTRWLSNEENIEILSEELGIEITNSQPEYSVGSFSVDIFAENSNGEKIIIENQLERTDHDHLGKLITYASGVRAKHVVWMVAKAREEHRSAIEWLNNFTNEDVNFFLIEIEVWKINDSLPAPKFNIIEKPNNWSKIVKTSTGSRTKNGVSAKYYNFFEYYNEYVSNNSDIINPRKPSLDCWTDYSIGKSGIHIVVTVDIRKRKLRAALWITDEKGFFYFLKDKKTDIKQEFINHNVIFDEKQGKKASSVVVLIDDFDIDDSTNWEEKSKETLEASEKIKKIFQKYYKEYENQK